MVKGLDVPEHGKLGLLNVGEVFELGLMMVQ
jgi:hypothetical protein